MAEFESSHDFRDFADFVKKASTYVLDGKWQHFMDVLLETSKKRRTSLSKGDSLWRAQLGEEEGHHRTDGIEDERSDGLESVEKAHPHHWERMKPRTDKVCEGRVNPKGVPYLYLSTERDTAMIEVRPVIGAYVSVARFVILKDLSLVDCVSDTRRPTIYPIGTPVPRDEQEEVVWGSVNQAFSKLVTRCDDVADYVPTQILAKKFREAGFDGIKYGSKRGNGKSIVLFDLTVADVDRCDLYQVEAFNPRFLEGMYSYNVPK
jgi:hypothetical protein